jgi:hypothetical protein
MLFLLVTIRIDDILELSYILLEMASKSPEAVKKIKDPVSVVLF